MPTDVLSSGGDEAGVGFFGHVVVVMVEAAAGDAVAKGERVQLRQIAVAHQVGPQPAVRRPQRIVDEDRHEPIFAGWRTGERMILGLGSSIR